MKEFEKRFSKPPLRSYSGQHEIWESRQEGWIAALEWALKNGQICTVCNLEEVIKKELDEDESF